MIREAARNYLNELLKVLKKHRKCLAEMNKLKDPPSVKTLTNMAGLPEHTAFLKDHLHLFAVQCRQDRQSTQFLVLKLDRELQGLLWKIGTIKAKKKRPKDFPELGWYLLDLEEVLECCSQQLQFELPMNYGPHNFGAATASGMYTGTYWGTQAQTGTGPVDFPQPTPAPDFEPTSQLVPSCLLFPAGTESVTPEPENPVLLESLPEELLSQFSSKLQGRQMKFLVKQLLQHVEDRIKNSSQPKKRGPKGKNRHLEFSELIYVLLLANMDLLLIKCIGAKHTYIFLAFLGGGNEKYAAEFLRHYRKDKDDSSRDPLYQLEGRYDELKAKALKIMGPLPGMILKLVKS